MGVGFRDDFVAVLDMFQGLTRFDVIYGSV